MIETIKVSKIYIFLKIIFFQIINKQNILLSIKNITSIRLFLNKFKLKYQNNYSIFDNLLKYKKCK